MTANAGALDVHVGVDVGGTNTDAVVVRQGRVLGWSKQLTTQDVTSGVTRAVARALEEATRQQTGGDTSLCVQRVHIGTTHFVNAVVQRRHLVRVGVVRLCGPASRALPPFADFPTSLAEVIAGPVHLVDGGYHFDGREIRPVNEPEVIKAIHQLRKDGIKNVVVSGIFSPVCNKQELKVGELLTAHYPECSVTLSHQIAHLGLLLRENAAVLNESLRPLSRVTITAFRNALDELKLTCPFFLSQNDGTLLSAEQSLATPVHTFASGATNSMRGAAYLSGVKDAIVVDIGGTSTDVGMLVGGFPRPAAVKVKVGGVSTNFRMPDVMSIGLGGGSLVLDQEGGKVSVGPQSVGFQLQTAGLLFGGDTLTASDIAVASGLVSGIGTHAEKLATLDPDLANRAKHRIQEMVEQVIDQVKTSEEAVPVILVGGGSILLDQTQVLKGSTGTTLPDNYQVANAVGAALSQVSGEVDTLEELTTISREDAILAAKTRATKLAIQAGAHPDTVEIVDVIEVPLSYVPGNVTRVKVQAVGDLDISCQPPGSGSIWSGAPEGIFDQQTVTGIQQMTSTTGQSLDDHTDDDLTVTETEPNIDTEKGEWLLSEWDLECISVGAGILGCGGGGLPHNGKLRAQRVLREGKRIRVITPERYVSQPCDDDGLVTPLFHMGAPIVWHELEYDFTQHTVALQALKEICKQSWATGFETLKDVKGLLYIDDYRPEKPDTQPLNQGEHRIAALVCAEIGGANSMAPLVAGAEHDIPIIDADCMGRAFPELQHMTPLMYGHPPYPGTLGSLDGQRAVILYADSPKALENHFRQVCVQMGCFAGFVAAPLRRDDISRLTIPYSYSHAWRLGQAVMHARRHKLDPIATILKHEGGMLLATGKICDVQRRTVGGFARGMMKIEGFGDYSGATMQINFQNENLVAKMAAKEEADMKLVACTPDLISLVDIDTGEPIATEEVRYGLRVVVLSMAAAAILRTPQALAAVGPQAFGYSPDEVTYTPFGECKEYKPIGPC